MIDTRADQQLPGLGTEQGIREAWQDHGAVLRAFAVRRLRDRDLAEDVLQETFLRAWRKADRFDAARGAVRTWLFAIMRNLLIDMSRAQASRPRTSQLAFDVAAADELDGVIGSLVVADALKALSVEHRQVIMLSCVAQRSHTEIAHVLGVPVGTVRSRLFYAREALSRVLDTPERAVAERATLHVAA